MCNVLLVDNEEESILKFDSGRTDIERIILFSTNKNLDYLSSSSEVNMDGTFKIVPSVFYQLYTIHRKVGTKLFPLAYILLPKKNERIYERTFDILKELIPSFNPQRAMIDFEMAVFNSLDSNFPEIKTSGCFFHFCQNMWKKIQTLGEEVIRNYSENAEFSLACRLLPALAFVPENSVEECFEEVANYIEERYPELAELVDYFEFNYIGGRRREARFPISWWNQFERVSLDLFRTNNSCEAHHRQMGSLFSCDHPDFYKFLREINNNIQYYSRLMSQVASGHVLSPRKRKCSFINERICRAKENWGLLTNIDYLKGVARCFIY